MGTGKSGRYLNTKGSGRTVSDFALVHSNEGTFTYTPKSHKISKLKSGGHGQDGMDLLDRHGIAYNVTKTYANGVRVAKKYPKAVEKYNLEYFIDSAEEYIE